MKAIKTQLAAVVVASSFLTSAFAITNPGFENPVPFAGWTVSIGTNAPTSAQVVSSYNAVQPSQPPVTYFPSIAVDPFGVAPTAAPGGTRFAKLTAGGQNQNITISQTFTMDFGYGLAGLAAFDAVGAASLNDIAELIISGNSVVGGSETIWNRTISTTGPVGATPWEVWSYYAPAYDTYTLTFRIRNVGSGSANSVALLDSLAIIQVPDNGSMLLMLGGVLLGLFGLKRKLVKA